MLDRLMAFLIAVRDFIGMPANITIWELANSELMIAVSAAGLGWFVNRKFNRMDEKQEAREEERSLERDMNSDAVTEEDVLDVPFPEPRAGSVPPAPPVPGSAPALPKRKSRWPTLGNDRKDEKQTDPNFQRGQALLLELKAAVDDRVARVKDGRRRRKYQTIGKRDYRVRIEALRRDDEIPHDEADLLMAGFETWRPYQSRKQDVPDQVIERLVEIVKALKASIDDDTTARQRRRRRLA